MTRREIAFRVAERRARMARLGGLRRRVPAPHRAHRPAGVLTRPVVTPDGTVFTCLDARTGRHLYTTGPATSSGDRIELERIVEQLPRIPRS